MKTKVLVIEFRAARKNEKELLGTTETLGDVSKIFINEKQSEGEAIDTFFHEVAHAYCHMMGSKLDDKIEEKIARLVGNVVEPCFRRYL